MAIKLQIRRGDAANWTSSNPTLLEGEIGYERDTGNWKVGDGTTAWQTLPYQFPYLTGSKALDTLTLVVDQANDRVGIGTATPLAKLHVEGTAPIIRMRDTDSGAGIYSEIGTSNTDGTIVISADAGNASGTSNASKIQFVIDNAATPQVTVLSDRKVGIGTASPTSSIHVVSSTTTADINLVNSGTSGGSGGLSISTSSNAASITNEENSTLTFGTNNTDRVTIAAGGNVGIGTTSPSAMLHIEGTSPVIRLKDSADDAYSHINADNTTGSLLLGADLGNAADSSVMQFSVDGSAKMTINSSGFVGIGEASPSASIHITRSGSVQMIHDTGASYSTTSTGSQGGVTIDADPANTSTGSTQFIVKTDGTERFRCQSTSGSEVYVPSSQTLHVVGTLKPTLGNITLNTIAHNALADINTSGGALLGRTDTGSVTQVSNSSVKSWLGLGELAYLDNDLQYNNFGYNDTGNITLSIDIGDYEIGKMYVIRNTHTYSGTGTNHGVEFSCVNSSTQRYILFKVQSTNQSSYPVTYGGLLDMPCHIQASAATSGLLWWRLPNSSGAGSAVVHMVFMRIS